MTTEDIEEDIFDGEDELNEVTFAKHQHMFVCFQVDFSEAEDVTEKRMIRHIFKVGYIDFSSLFLALS